MGSVNSTGSKLEKALGSDLPEDERYFGLENFGNTCYCNSVLQALYFCEPFRKAILSYAHNRQQQQQQQQQPHSSGPLSSTTYPSSDRSDRQSSSQSNPTSSSATTSHLSVSSFLSSTPNGPTQQHQPPPTQQQQQQSGPTSSSASAFRNAVKGVVHAYSSATGAASSTTTTTTTTTPVPPNPTTPIPTPADIERPLSEDDTMLTALADLFSTIASQKKRTGSVPPKSFVTKLRQENELFSSYMHQDAHEFLNFILNNIVECLHREAAAQQRQQQQRNIFHSKQSNSFTNIHYQNHITSNSSPTTPPPPPTTTTTLSSSSSTATTTTVPSTSKTKTTSSTYQSSGHEASNGQQPTAMENGSMDLGSTFSAQGVHATVLPQSSLSSSISPLSSTASAATSTSEPRTFVHELFEGQLSNEVRCLCCETVTQRVESFFDLSVDVEQNSSITACLRSFSSTELLQKQDKFFCDACCSLQEAERRMRVKRLPRILALHLKRFKYVEHLGKYKKLSYRVVFPLELRLCNTSDDAQDPDRLYSLFAVVVHVGSGPNQGHYVSLIKSHGQWLLFDDDCVEPKDESEIQSVYGITQESTQSTEAGYILFYEQTSST